MAADVVKFGHGRFYLVCSTDEVTQMTIETVTLDVRYPHQLTTSMVFSDEVLTKWDDWARKETEALGLMSDVYLRRNLVRPITAHKFFKTRAYSAAAREGTGQIQDRKREIYILIRDLWEQSQGCQLCGCRMSIERTGDDRARDTDRQHAINAFIFSVDAIIPRSKGQAAFQKIKAGTWSIGNDGLLVQPPPTTPPPSDFSPCYTWASRQLSSIRDRCEQSTLEHKVCDLQVEDLVALVRLILVTCTTYLDVSGAELDLDMASINQVDSAREYIRGSFRVIAWFLNAVKSDWATDESSYRWLSIQSGRLYLCLCFCSRVASTETASSVNTIPFQKTCQRTCSDQS